MIKTVILEWEFSPPDYFEEPIEISLDNYIMKIEAGNVTATIDYSVFSEKPSLREDLRVSLNNRFLAAQLLSHQKYEFFSSRMTHVYDDGLKHIFVGISSAVMVVAAGSLDFVHKDKDGNIISNSKRDRIEKKKNLSELIITYTNDQLAGALLKSYNAAVADPNNELVHLYEIRDALSKKFGNESKVRKNLAITSSQWSRLGQLSNDEPLKQGRHRGKAVDTLRDATESELAEAREISRTMIEAYLQSLEDLNT